MESSHHLPVGLIYRSPRAREIKKRNPFLKTKVKFTLQLVKEEGSQSYLWQVGLERKFIEFS